MLKAFGPVAGAVGNEGFALSRQGSKSLVTLVCRSTYSYNKPATPRGEGKASNPHLKPRTPGDSWHSETSETDVKLSPSNSRRHHRLGKASRNQLLAVLVAGPGPTLHRGEVSRNTC